MSLKTSFQSLIMSTLKILKKDRSKERKKLKANNCQEKLFGIKNKKKTGNLLTCPLPETTLKTRIIILSHAHSRITAVLISATSHFDLWFVYCFNILREARFVHYKCARVRFLKF